MFISMAYARYDAAPKFDSSGGGGGTSNSRRLLDCLSGPPVESKLEGVA